MMDDFSNSMGMEHELALKFTLGHKIFGSQIFGLTHKILPTTLQWLKFVGSDGYLWVHCPCARSAK